MPFTIRLATGHFFKWDTASAYNQLPLDPHSDVKVLAPRHHQTGKWMTFPPNAPYLVQYLLFYTTTASLDA